MDSHAEGVCLYRFLLDSPLQERVSRSAVPLHRGDWLTKPRDIYPSVQEDVRRGSDPESLRGYGGSSQQPEDRQGCRPRQVRQTVLVRSRTTGFNRSAYQADMRAHFCERYHHHGGDTDLEMTDVS
jgi:hypothetical protein